MFIRIWGTSEGVLALETAIELLEMLGQAAVQLVAQPFYYIAVLFIILQYTRQIRVERQMFAVKLHHWPSLVLKAMLTGLLIGVAVSIAGAFVGVSLTGEAVLWLWAVAAILMLIRIRYLCFAYSAGVITLLQWLIGWTTLTERTDWLGSLAVSLQELMLLVCLCSLRCFILQKPFLFAGKVIDYRRHYFLRVNVESSLAAICCRAFGQFRCLCWYRQGRADHL